MPPRQAPTLAEACLGGATVGHAAPTSARRYSRLRAVGWLVSHGLAPEQALFDATRVLAGVGPAEAPAGDRVYPLPASAAMLATVAFTALFTAGVVERMLNLKLVGLTGPRTLPHSGHVIVVGMGQVGMRLCMELRRRTIPFAGVERDPDTATARLAPALA